MSWDSSRHAPHTCSVGRGSSPGQRVAVTEGEGSVVQGEAALVLDGVEQASLPRKVQQCPGYLLQPQLHQPEKGQLPQAMRGMVQSHCLCPCASLEMPRVGTCQTPCPCEVGLSAKPTVTAGLGGGSFPQSPQCSSSAQTRFPIPHQRQRPDTAMQEKVRCAGAAPQPGYCQQPQPGPEVPLLAFLHMLLSHRRAGGPGANSPTSTTLPLEP